MIDEPVSGWVEVRWRDASYHLRVPDAEVDYIQGRVQEDGVPYEEPLLAEMATRLLPGDLVLDVGANVGNHTLFLACALHCRVEAFEPDQHLVGAIRESVERNEVAHLVRTHPLAVGASRGRGTLVSIDPKNLGAQRVSVDGPASGLGEGLGAAESVRVDVAALDDLEFDGPVRLMKVDVEGGEAAVLRGAARLLVRDRPILYVECLTVADFDFVESFLGPLGYLWLGVWNPSPTHCFVHRDEIASDPALRGRLREISMSLYTLREQAQSAKERLDRANLMYRKLARRAAAIGEKDKAGVEVVLANAEGARLQIERLSGELASMRIDLAHRIDTHLRSTWDEHDLRRQLVLSTEGIDSLRRQLREEQERAEDLRRRTVGLESERDDLATRLDGQRVALEAAAAWKDRVRRDLKLVRRHIEAQADRAEELAAAEGVPSLGAALTELDELRASHKASTAELQEQVRIARAERDAYRRKLIDLRGSLTYRVGKAVRDAMHSPGGLFRVLPAIWRARQAPKETHP